MITTLRIINILGGLTAGVMLGIIVFTALTSKPERLTPPSPIETITHDGHRFVVYTGRNGYGKLQAVAMLHHPDCR